MKLNQSSKSVEDCTLGKEPPLGLGYFSVGVGREMIHIQTIKPSTMHPQILYQGSIAVLNSRGLGI